MLKIIPIRALKDNYIWAGIDDQSGNVFVVDPGDATPVFDFLNEHHLKLTNILVTHKHADHMGGIAELMKAYTGIKVYSHPLEKVSGTTDFVEEGDFVSIGGGSLSFRVIHIPGHTLGHVAYYADSIVFTGDTLFGAGCGRLFEGTAEQMYSSLNKLKALPDDVLVYCGHEYTLANLHFAKLVEPNNQNIIERMKQTEKLLSSNFPSLPSTMSLEKKTNPFLRCDGVDAFAEVRKWKDGYKAF